MKVDKTQTQFSKFNPMVVAGLILVLIVSFGVYQYKVAVKELQKSLSDKLMQEHTNFIHELKARVDAHIHELGLLALAVQQKNALAQSEFLELSQRVLQYYPEVSAVEWVPKVLQSQRVMHESTLVDQGYLNYQITQKMADNQLERAPEKKMYFPIMYVEPYEANQKIHGFDVTSRPFNKMMITELSKGAHYVLSPPFKLLQDLDGNKSILIYMPVRSSNQKDLKGVLLFIIRVSDLFGHIKQHQLLPKQTTYGLKDISLYAVEVGQNPTFQKTLWLDNQMLSYEPNLPKNRLIYPSFKLNQKEQLLFGKARWEMNFHVDLKDIPEYQKSVFLYRQNIFLYLTFATIFAFLLFYLIKDFNRFLTVKTQLKFEQDRLHTLFFRSSDLYLLIDQSGGLVEVNQKTCEVLGYTPEGLIDHSFRNIWYEDSTFWHVIQALDYGEKSETEEILRARDGSKIVVSVTVFKMQVNGILYYSCLIKDLTLYKKQMQVMEQAVVKSEEAGRLKSEFLANMSHELRTPLHGILSFATLGETRAEAEKLKSYFSAIRVSGERLLKILTEILELSKIENTQMQFDIHQTEFNRLVSVALREQSSEVLRKNIQLNVNGPASDISLEIDENRVLQVLANLISNAIKFSPEKGIIDIEWRLSFGLTQQVLFCIRNQGEGLAPEELESIFDKFVQAKRHSHVQSGSGLGLSICREILQRHQGKIWAESVLGEYTKLCFTLPIKQLTD